MSGPSDGLTLRVKSITVWDEADTAAKAAIKEIREASDRAAGIVSAAFVEDYLTDAIKATSQESKDLHKRLFSPEGMFGSFGAKIRLGFLVGLYDDVLMQELDVISKIRNKFAHRRDADTFESSPVRDQVLKLTAANTVNVTVSGTSETETYFRRIRDLVPPNASGRERYIGTCNMFIAIFIAVRIGANPANPAITAHMLENGS